MPANFACAALPLLLLLAVELPALDLQQSIDAARPGDTLRVPAGVHEGNLVVRQRVALVGAENAVLRGDGTGSVIAIAADSCIVSGFIIERCGRTLADDNAGILVRSSHNRIERNVLRDVLFGIYLRGADSNFVSGNSITGRKELSLGDRGSGIHLWDSNGNVLTRNVITDMRDGFYIQNANHTRIEYNKVFNLRYGLHYMYADSNTFLFNQFYDNVAGAAIMYSTGIVMRHNAFLRNRGFASYGILFQDCHDLTADSNLMVDNVVGMFFESTTDCIFRHNVIALNDVAMQMFQNSVSNVFTENNFIDNLSPLVLVGKQTGSAWSAGGRGNYWSGYDGYDLDDDGIGDVPLRIQNVFEYLEGKHPYARLYLYSPASQALAMSAAAFPILEVSQEIDSYPLMRPADLRALPILRMISADEAASRKHSFPRHLGMLLATAAVALLGFGWWSRHTYKRGRS